MKYLAKYNVFKCFIRSYMTNVDYISVVFYWWIVSIYRLLDIFNWFIDELDITELNVLYQGILDNECVFNMTVLL